jgi:hypothetical protein
LSRQCVTSGPDGVDGGAAGQEEACRAGGGVSGWVQARATRVTSRRWDGCRQPQAGQGRQGAPMCDACRSCSNHSSMGGALCRAWQSRCAGDSDARHRAPPREGCCCSCSAFAVPSACTDATAAPPLC